MSDRLAESAEVQGKPESSSPADATRLVSGDGLVAAITPFSPPLAVLLLILLSIRRRNRLIEGLRGDWLTLVIGVVLALTGAVEVVRFHFGQGTFGDVLGVLALIWLFLAGEHVLANPSGFLRTLSRSLGGFALMGLLAYFLPVTAKFHVLGQNIVLIEHVPGNVKATRC